MFGTERKNQMDGVQRVFVPVVVNDSLYFVSMAMMARGEFIESVMSHWE